MINPTFQLHPSHPDVRLLGEFMDRTSPIAFTSARLTFGFHPETGEEAMAAGLLYLPGYAIQTTWNRSADAMDALDRIFTSVHTSSERARFMRELVDLGRTSRCRRTGRVIVQAPRYTQTSLIISPKGKAGVRRTYPAEILFLCTSPVGRLAGGN